MKITIIFSTYNGSYTLPRMLNRLCKLISPKGEWEIIAVDNASKDNSFEILKNYQYRLPLKIIQEYTQGKNVALNRALNEDIGDLLIFTDDDVLPENDWLVKYEKLAVEQRDYQLFGGSILPVWEKFPSKDLLDNIPVGVAYAVTPHRDKPGEIRAGKIWGPNMAVRKIVFDNGLQFNNNIGPNGTNYVMGSETDFLKKAASIGYRAFFDPQIIVGHIIRPWQLEDKWLKKRAYKVGRATIHGQIRANNFVKVKTLFGYPRWALLDLFINFWKLKFSLNKANFYRQLWQVYIMLGFCYEYKLQCMEGMK